MISYLSIYLSKYTITALENIRFANFLINSNLYKVYLHYEIVFNGGSQHLDGLLQKWHKYQYHQLKLEA